MSFHPRKYYEKHDQFFPTDKFKRYLASGVCYNLINSHLLNTARFGKLMKEDAKTFIIASEMMDKILDWQETFPDWLQNREFKKWISFLMSEELKKKAASDLHLKNEKNGRITWSHAKKNTMKLFFNDRDERSRDLELSENEEKFKIFTNFIKQMSNKTRQFDKFIKE